MHYGKCASVAVIAAATMAIAVACSAFDPDDPDDADVRAGDGGSPEAALGTDGSRPPTACEMAKLDSDPVHCGRCDHSCLGGACESGKCQPVLIGVSKGELVLDVAVDDKQVLWHVSNQSQSGPGHLYACSKAGCGGAPPMSLLPEGSQIGNLAGDGVTAYVNVIYGQARAIYRVEGNTVAKQPTGDHGNIVELHMQGGALFYLSLYQASTMGGAQSAYTLSKGVESTIAKHDGPGNFYELTPAGATAFISGFNPGILRCTGTTCEPFGDSLGSGVLDVATDGTNVFWAKLSPPGVVSCPIAGACAVGAPALGTAQLNGGEPRGVVYERGTLYVTTTTGDIITCDPKNCATTAALLVHEPRLYTGREFFFGKSITTDDNAIYWAALDETGPINSDAGPDGSLVENTSMLTHRIMKLAK
jgi:hypothetical protein